jgi:hypothetical protein
VERPNFAEAPADSAHLPADLACSFTRMPIIGSTPISRPTSMMRVISSSFSATSTTFLPRRMPISAMRMKPRSL